MDAEKLKHFQTLLLNQLRQSTEQIRTDQAAALELYDDGVKDSVDLSVQDLNKEIALRLGERSSQVVADIDQALLRIFCDSSNGMSSSSLSTRIAVQVVGWPSTCSESATAARMISSPTTTSFICPAAIRSFISLYGIRFVLPSLSM
jgi:hypothetical protein